MEDRCTGHCCEAFNIGPPERVQQDAELARKKPPEERTAQDNEDIQVAEMVIYLGNFQRNPVHATFAEFRYDFTVKRDAPSAKPIEGGDFHTCKHFDKEARICRIYDTRPSMCRRYPNDRRCEFVRCTSRTFRMLGEERLDIIPASLLRRDAIERGAPPVSVLHFRKVCAAQDLRLTLDKENADEQVPDEPLRSAPRSHPPADVEGSPARRAEG